MSEPRTVEAVARYLLTRLEQSPYGELIWSDLVPELEQWPEGAQFLAVNRNGHKVFHPEVLRAFRALTGARVVQIGWGRRIGWRLADHEPPR